MLNQRETQQGQKLWKLWFYPKFLVLWSDRIIHFWLKKSWGHSRLWSVVLFRPEFAILSGFFSIAPMKNLIKLAPDYSLSLPDLALTCRVPARLLRSRWHGSTFRWSVNSGFTVPVSKWGVPPLSWRKVRHANSHFMGRIRTSGII